MPHHIFIYTLLSILIGSFFVGGFYTYSMYENREQSLNLANTKLEEAATRISNLENQVAALNIALQSSLSTSEETRQKLQAELQALSKRPSPAPTASAEDRVTAAVSKGAPAVVSIVVSKDVPLLRIQYVDPFGENGDSGIRVPVYRQVGTQEQRIGAGTGFIIRSDGYILTNRHVVSDTQADYTVLLSSGDQRTAQVVYRDPTNDIAILKIPGSNYSRLLLGDSDNIKLGQSVVAIGNALGEYSNSVSVGIISGLNRSITAQDEQGRTVTLSDVIQTDAAINRGNSGGPLLDLSGNAIGINVAIQRGANNISFSIPINSAKAVINQVLPN